MKTITSDEASQRARLGQVWPDERAVVGVAQRPEDPSGECKHRERDHILSESMVVPHMRTHVAMLGAGPRRHGRREVIGIAEHSQSSMTFSFPVIEGMPR